MAYNDSHNQEEMLLNWVSGSIPSELVSLIEGGHKASGLSTIRKEFPPSKSLKI